MTNENLFFSEVKAKMYFNPGLWCKHIVGEGLRRSFATPNSFVLSNKICLNQTY